MPSVDPPSVPPPLVAVQRASPQGWKPPTLPIPFDKLPALPSIRDPALALQALSSKDYVGWKAGRGSHATDEDEGASYRPLEWYGDVVLRRAIGDLVFQRFAHSGSSILSVISQALNENTFQSHLSLAYGLPSALLDAPPPAKPSPRWKPLSASQNIAADLLEAHIGALVRDGREDDVQSWVGGLFTVMQGALDAKVNELLRRAGERAVAKRALEEDTDQDHPKRLRHSFLECSYSTDLEPSASPQPALEWSLEERVLVDGGAWHCHLSFSGVEMSCGRGPKKDKAHEAALAHLLDRSMKPKNESDQALRAFLWQESSTSPSPSQPALFDQATPTSSADKVNDSPAPHLDDSAALAYGAASASADLLEGTASPSLL